MSFPDFDIFTRLARDRQQELIEHAAEQRLIRKVKESHPSRWRRRPSGPDAA